MNQNFVIDPDNDSNREVVLWSSGTNNAAATVTRDNMPRSSSGQGHRPLKAEITGSNPVRGTTLLCIVYRLHIYMHV